MIYYGDIYYDESWSVMSKDKKTVNPPKDYLVVIRQPKLAGPTVWAGPGGRVTAKRDMEGWNRIKDTIERKLTTIAGSKPEWMQVHNAFKLSLTEAQVSEIKMWGSDVRSVIEFTK